MLAPEIVFHGSPGAEMPGRAAFSDSMHCVQAAFLDFRNQIEEMVAEADRVAARLTYTGTHRGEIFGVAPTGKVITYAGAAFYRIENGQVAQGWVPCDLAVLLRQLGTRTLP